MQLEDYFDFVSNDEIRVRGTRVGIEAIVREYSSGALPEDIALNYPPLTLEHVHATITYYLRNRSLVDDYLTRWQARGDAAREQQQQSSSSLLNRLITARRAETPA